MNRRSIPVNELLTRLWDFCVLNLLFLLCSLPIVTVGAALTAMHRVLLQFVRDDDVHYVKDFFAAFRQEFRQSTLLWLPLLLIGVVLAADLLYILPGLEGAMRTLFFVATLFFEVFWLLLMIYVWPLQARYANPVHQTVKNALLIGIWKFPQTILCAAIYLALPLAYMLRAEAQPVVMLLSLVCGFSLTGFLADSILNRVFLDVIPGEREFQTGEALPPQAESAADDESDAPD